MIAVPLPPSDLERFARLLWRPGDVREVRIPTPGRTDAGYFDSPDELVRAVTAVDGRQNVYVTVNPVDPSLMARASNRIKTRIRTTTGDANVVERRWLPIDIDPVRPSDISASEAEREAALEVARSVWRYLSGLGWPEPVSTMSGNGYWLLYPIDLPNDEASKALVDGVLAHLAERFNTSAVTIDTTVSNASRIVAMIGTVKVKGDATTDRPHRRSGLLRQPAELVPVAREMMAALAPEHPAARVVITSGDRMPEGWVGTLLAQAGVSARVGHRGGRTWYRLASCPFHPDDDQGGDCGVGEDAEGKGLGHCFHNRGAGKGWQDFKAALGLQTTVWPMAPVAHAAPQPKASTRIDAADLLALSLRPLRWVVPDIIPEGTTILAAPPKVGKSCLIYQIAVEAAIGGDLIDRRVTPGSVLYLALEDGKRRGQARLLAALAGRTMPRGRLEVQWDAPNIGAGLEEEIHAWLDSHPDAVMVAIDTLGKVRGASSGRRNAYEVDVEAMNKLQDLFRDRPVALVIVHHARKEGHEDILGSVSGTYGITGSVDTIVVVRRMRNETFGTFHITGRDVVEDSIPVQFNNMTWTSAPATLPAASFERTEVYRYIEGHGPVFPAAIAAALGFGSRKSVDNMVQKLVADGAVARRPKGYVVVGVRISLSPPDSSDGSESHQGNRGYPRDMRAREDDGPARMAIVANAEWLHACRVYAAHQSAHRQTPLGWTCDTCYPEGAS